jgi:hypothetical protein
MEWVDLAQRMNLSHIHHRIVHYTLLAPKKEVERRRPIFLLFTYLLYYNNSTSFKTTADGWYLNEEFSFPGGETGRGPLEVPVSPVDFSITFTFPKGAVKLYSDHQNIVLTRGTKTITVRIYDKTGYVEIL